MTVPSIIRFAPVALLLLGCSTQSSQAEQPPTVSSVPPDGARLFQRRCAVCHGAEGQGMEMAMGGQSANLTDAALQARLSDAALLRVMLHGAGRMPAVSGLRQDEAAAIAAHVRSIRKP